MLRPHASLRPRQSHCLLTRHSQAPAPTVQVFAKPRHSRRAVNPRKTRDHAPPLRARSALRPPPIRAQNLSVQLCGTGTGVTRTGPPPGIARFSIAMSAAVDHDHRPPPPQRPPRSPHRPAHHQSPTRSANPAAKTPHTRRQCGRKEPHATPHPRPLFNPRPQERSRRPS